MSHTLLCIKIFGFNFSLVVAFACWRHLFIVSGSVLLPFNSVLCVLFYKNVRHSKQITLRLHSITSMGFTEFKESSKPFFLVKCNLYLRQRSWWLWRFIYLWKKCEIPRKVQFWKREGSSQQLTDVDSLEDGHIWCLRCAVFGVVMNDGLYCYLHLIDAAMHYYWTAPIRFPCDFERVAPIRPARNTFHINHSAVPLCSQTMNLTANRDKHDVIESIDWKFMWSQFRCSELHLAEGRKDSVKSNVRVREPTCQQGTNCMDSPRCASVFLVHSAWPPNDFRCVAPNRLER